MNNDSLKKRKNIIAKQLIRKVMLFAGLATILLTIFIGFITYYVETIEFNQQFDEIEKSYKDVIRTALWIDDKETIRMVLSGICDLPGIEYADIHSKDSIFCASGKKTSSEKLVRIFPITHVYNGNPYQLGALHVQGSSDYLQHKIVKTVITVTFTQALTIFTICALVLWLIYSKVIRRMIKITTYTSSLSLESLITPLVMGKTTEPLDELDDLTDAINHMRENLHQAFIHKKVVEDQLQENLKNLDKIVAERTSSLRITNERLQSEVDERTKIEKEREKLIQDLQQALSEVNKLSGLLPICSYCKKIRDDKGYWNQIESYIHEHSEAEFSHSICQECAKKHYPDFDIYDDDATQHR